MQGHYFHEKNPAAAAAVLATIAFIESENLPGHVHEFSAFVLARLRAMQARHPLIGDVRGLGLMLGGELGTGRP